MVLSEVEVLQPGANEAVLMYRLASLFLKETNVQGKMDRMVVVVAVVILGKGSEVELIREEEDLEMFRVLSTIFC